MKLVAAVAIAVLGVTGLSGCASNRKSAAVDWSGRSSAPVLSVQNDNWLDVVVYVVRGASRIRVGTVRSASTETFRLISEGTSGTRPLQVMADPIGSNRTYVTDPIVLGPGQWLEVRVADAINTSTYAVRSP